MSLISAWAQSSTHPVTEILNLRGRLAYSRLPVKKSDTARAIGQASNASSASTPDTGQHRTLRAESPHAWTVVRPDGGEPAPDAGDVLDAQPVDLHGLAGGEVGEARPEHPALGAVGTLAEGVGGHPDLAGLRRGEEPAGHLDPHHEGVAPLLLRVDAGPLEPLDLAGHLGDARRALLRVGVDDGVGDLERVARQLPLLDLVELALGPVGIDEGHRTVGAADVEPVELVAVLGHLGRFISDVQPALDLVRVGPPAGARVLALAHRTGGRRAADREVALGEQRVLGDAVVARRSRPRPAPSMWPTG